MNDHYWRERYEALKTKVAVLADELNFEREEQPPACISDSEEFWISNSLEICDSEEYALDTWGEGNFFKVKKV